MAKIYSEDEIVDILIDEKKMQRTNLTRKNFKMTPAIAGAMAYRGLNINNYRKSKISRELNKDISPEKMLSADGYLPEQRSYSLCKDRTNMNGVNEMYKGYNADRAGKGFSYLKAFEPEMYGYYGFFLAGVGALGAILGMGATGILASVPLVAGLSLPVGFCLLGACVGKGISRIIANKKAKANERELAKQLKEIYKHKDFNINLHEYRIDLLCVAIAEAHLKVVKEDIENIKNIQPELFDDTVFASKLADSVKENLNNFVEENKDDPNLEQMLLEKYKEIDGIYTDKKTELEAQKEKQEERRVKEEQAKERYDTAQASVDDFVSKLKPKGDEDGRENE